MNDSNNWQPWVSTLPSRNPCAEQKPLCMAKRIEELEAQVRAMAELLRDARKYVTALGKPDDEVSAVQMTVSRIDALLAGQVPAPAAAEGWQLVPVEPTREMMASAMSAVTQPQDLLYSQSGWGMNEMAARTRYCAMLAAAPKLEAK